MKKMVNVAGLTVAKSLFDFVADELLSGLDLEAASFWDSLVNIVRELGPENSRLLAERDRLQSRLDQWHSENRGRLAEPSVYRDFLLEIGYLVPEGDDFSITVTDVDPEISKIAGPQLVVPVDNARYALNAANARWGSLYDAMYGTDVISEAKGREKTSGYNPVRGEAVIRQCLGFLDETFPLKKKSHADVRRYLVENADGVCQLAAELEGGATTGLMHPEKFAGFTKKNGNLINILLCNNGLHVELQIDPEHPVGCAHPAGIKDIIIESAITTIQDYEDSVAAVDADDKVSVYRNWLGLMTGGLEAAFIKDGKKLIRSLNPDRVYTAPDGARLALSGRSLMLVRNVGMHMVTDAVTTADGKGIPEAFLDAMVTLCAAMYDIKGIGRFKNSKTASIYIVKPKLHGPDEVKATVDLFSRVESTLGLLSKTVKIGIMDEERRTTLNLKECIRQAKDRVIFINTGFLDRTGDEIHSIMAAGPVLPKTDMKSAPWMLAYEDLNVATGLLSGFRGRAQIGKGMWAKPDAMAEMLSAKINHPESGANTAWVPSPTAATLHALHYHKVAVVDRQLSFATKKIASRNDLFVLPLCDPSTLTSEAIEKEVRNNAQSILGYVVRWIDRGIGCSKVPDIQNIGLMEDRATLRISSQHIANWIAHGLIGKARVLELLKEMAAVVDRQNAADPAYRPMSDNFNESIAFQAARDLIFKGGRSPNGYTEWILSENRLVVKARDCVHF